MILLLAAGLRFHALARDARFHPDEALFSTFARSAALDGDWLLHGPLDKTPLTLYSMALSMTAFSSSEGGLNRLDVYLGEFAARLPNTLASILSAAVMYALAKTLYRQKWVGVVAALLTALSPFAIAFSATAFTDGLMLLFITLALWLAASGRWGWSGLWLALGFASKQQAVFYIPLILAIGWLMSPPQKARFIAPLPTAVRFIMPLAACMGLLTAWDAARAQDTSFWALAAANNNPARLIRANEVLPRLIVWLADGGALLGPALITALLIGVAVVALVWRMRRESGQRSTLVDALLATYILGYGFVHWLVAFNTYDRYLLLLLPPIILLASRGLVWIGQTAKDLTQGNRGTEEQRKLSASLLLCFSVLCFFLFIGAADASEGRVNVGGDRGGHDGIDRLAAYLDSRPLGAIIYDYWLGWELDYYLGQWTNKRRVYYPTPEALAADALRQPDPAPRYFPVPTDEPVRPWLEALRQAGFAVTLDYAEPGFAAYKLIPPKASA